MKTVQLLGIGLSVLTFAAGAAVADEKVGKLIQALDDPQSAVVLSAVTKLGNYGSAAKEAVPALSKQLRCPTKEVSRKAAQALAQIGPPAIAELIKALQDPAPAVRTRALLAIGTMGREGSTALMPVSAFLKDEDAKVRLTAALVLGAMHEQARPAAASLESALRDSDPNVRFVAADSLKQIGPDAVKHLVTGAQRGATADRANALKLLGWFPESPAAVNALVEALKDRDIKLRAVAAGTLSRLGRYGKPALPRLLQSLAEDDLEIQIQGLAAVMAIAERGDSDLRDALSALNEKAHWAGPYYPPSFIADPKKGIKALLVFVGAPDPTQRLAAVLTLGRLGLSARSALPVVQQTLLADRNHSVRAAAYFAVTAIDPQQSADWGKVDALISKAVESQKDSRDPAELVRLHMLISSMPSVRFRGRRADQAVKESIEKNKQWVRDSLERARFPFEDLPSLVEGINLPAQFNLGFTEPFSSLVLKLESVVQASNDPRLAVFVFNNLGKGVPPDSDYLPALQQRWSRLLSKVPLEVLILEKQQQVQNLERNKAVRALDLFLNVFS